MECVFFFIIFLLYRFVILLFSTWATYFSSFKSSTCCFGLFLSVLGVLGVLGVFANLATDLIFGLVVLLSTRLFRANSSSLDFTELLMPLSALSLLFLCLLYSFHLFFKLFNYFFLSTSKISLCIAKSSQPTNYWKEINFR